MARLDSWSTRQIRISANHFRQAADERWKDAQCLHANKRFEGAIYLCGYVLECFLKFVLCEVRNHKSMDLNEAKQLGHNLIELLDASRMRATLRQNRDLLIAFDRINNHWEPQLRYSGKATDERSSEIFLRDTRSLRKWLEQQIRLIS